MRRSSESRPNDPVGQRRRGAVRRALRLGVLQDDTGSAALEFLGAGVMLLVPMVYLVVTLAQIETAAFATEGAARHAARIVARDGGADPTGEARRSVEMTAGDFGIDPNRLVTTMRCDPDPTECQTPDGIVTVDIRIEVPLPLVPPALDAALPLRVTVGASASARNSDLVPEL